MVYFDVSAYLSRNNPQGDSRRSWRRSPSAPTAVTTAGPTTAIIDRVEVGCWTKWGDYAHLENNDAAIHNDKLLHGSTEGLKPLVGPKSALIGKNIGDTSIIVHWAPNNMGVEGLLGSLLLHQGRCKAESETQREGFGGVAKQIDVVTFRNNLNKIGSIAMSDRQTSAWKIRACILPTWAEQLYDETGTLTLRRGQEDDKTSDRQPHSGRAKPTLYLDCMETGEVLTPMQQYFTDFGPRFEHYCTGGPEGVNRILADVEKFFVASVITLGVERKERANEDSSYTDEVKRRQTESQRRADDELSVLMSAEIDSRRPSVSPRDATSASKESQPTDDCDLGRSLGSIYYSDNEKHVAEQVKISPSSLELQRMRKSYTEIKTHRIPDEVASQVDWWRTPPGPSRVQRSASNFRKFKLMKAWLQSYLGGVPRILMGYRDEVGVIKTVEEIDTAALPKACAEEWNPSDTVRLISDVLSWFREELVRLVEAERKKVKESEDDEFNSEEEGNEWTQKCRQRNDFGSEAIFSFEPSAGNCIGMIPVRNFSTYSSSSSNSKRPITLRERIISTLEHHRKAMSEEEVDGSSVKRSSSSEASCLVTAPTS